MSALRIMGSQDSWFGDPSPMILRSFFLFVEGEER